MSAFKQWHDNADMPERDKTQLSLIIPTKLQGNQNAAKPDEAKAVSFIHARCKTSDKAAWVKAAGAQGLKLTEWIVNTLNKAS